MLEIGFKIICMVEEKIIYLHFHLLIHKPLTKFLEYSKNDGMFLARISQKVVITDTNSDDRFFSAALLNHSVT